MMLCLRDNSWPFLEEIAFKVAIRQGRNQNPKCELEVGLGFTLERLPQLSTQNEVFMTVIPSSVLFWTGILLQA